MSTEEPPCIYSARLREKLMDSQSELTTVDQSVYGLVVFLVIFLLFATLTSGLLVCLTKIWCGFKQNSGGGVRLTEKQRNSILRSPALGEDDFSDEESSQQEPQQSLSARRFSQRIMSYVHKSLGESNKNKEKEPDRTMKVYGADNGIPLPTICTTEPSTSNLNADIEATDPSTVVHV